MTGKATEKLEVGSGRIREGLRQAQPDNVCTTVCKRLRQAQPDSAGAYLILPKTKKATR